MSDSMRELRDISEMKWAHPFSVFSECAARVPTHSTGFSYIVPLFYQLD